MGQGYGYILYNALDSSRHSIIMGSMLTKVLLFPSKIDMQMEFINTV